MEKPNKRNQVKERFPKPSLIKEVMKNINTNIKKKLQTEKTH